MSSPQEIAASIPQAPVLYGIDPSVTYKWVPLSFRQEFRDKAFDATFESLKLREITDETEKQLVIERELIERFKGRRIAHKDAPWVEIGPLPSDIGLRLEAAGSVYQRQLAAANRRMEAEIEAAKAKKLKPTKETAALDEIKERYTEANIGRGIAAYGVDLIQDVLTAAVRGWSGFKAPFVSWEESGGIMPASDQFELFWDIVNANAWTPTAFESFEYAPVCQQA